MKRSQPAPAYDLLVRFLTQKSMIDEELPQVRSSQPVQPNQPSWLHLYPQGKHAYDDSFSQSPILSPTNNEASSTTIEASLSPSTGGTTGSSSSSIVPALHSSHMGLMMAFLAGLGVALVIANIVNRRTDRSRRVAGYSAVPDTAATKTEA